VSAASGAGSRSGGSRKSPLRLATDPVPVISDRSLRAADPVADRRRGDRSPAEQRQVMISEYGEWLRTQTNRHGRPFQAETISAYRDAAVALSSQGGTNTKQRNLRHLFTWLASEYGHPHPYSDALVRYAPVKVRPSTLAADFIRDLLAVTGDGRARGFHDARDGQGDRGLPPGAAVARAGPGLAGVVAGDQEPQAGDREWRVADGQAVGGAGRV
jgi:hypothetical protein